MLIRFGASSIVQSFRSLLQFQKSGAKLSVIFFSLYAQTTIKQNVSYTVPNAAKSALLSHCTLLPTAVQITTIQSLNPACEGTIE